MTSDLEPISDTDEPSGSANSLTSTCVLGHFIDLVLIE